MKKKNSIQKIGVISGKNLLINSAGKLGKHDAIVQSGTGAHKNVKQYNRKGKANQQLKNELKGFDSGVVIFLLGGV